MTSFKRLTAALLALLFVCSAHAQTIKSGHVLGNGTASERTATDSPLLSIMQQAGSGLGTGVGTLLGGAASGTGGPLGSVSPAITGTPTAPTAALGTNTTQLATMAAVRAAAPITTHTIYATSFGVVCDGATDNTQALNSFHAAITNGTVAVYPPGMCLFNGGAGGNTITPGALNPLPLASNVKLVFNGATLVYDGGITTQTLYTVGGGAVCTASRWEIDGLQLYSTTVMTAGYGVYVDNICGIQMYYTRVGTYNADLFNGIYAQGTQFLYAFGLAATASNSVCSFAGNTGTQANQSTDTFIYSGTCESGVIGLLLGGNVGGFYADAVDVEPNHLNVRIDQSLVPLCNQQVAFGPEFASDATTGAPNGGISIHDPGCLVAGLVTDIFFHGSWLSTASGTCLAVDSGVGATEPVNIHLENVRMAFCGTGLANSSATAKIIINGGEWHDISGDALDNGAGGPIKIQSMPTMYNNGTDLAGMAPALSSCGSGPTINTTQSWDNSGIFTPQATSCTLTFLAPWHASPACNLTGVGSSTYPFISGVTGALVTFTGLTSGISYLYNCSGLH